MKKICYRFPLCLFALLTGYLLVAGVFFWDGGNTAYGNTNIIVRGLQMAGTVLLCLLIVARIAKWTGQLTEKRRLYITCVCGVIMVVGQFLFVAVAEAGIRYDSLKVLEEAIALFHQEGMLAEDLDGYFARYSNNYAITIFTHLALKIFKMPGLLRSDFSNGVILLQYCNIILVDLALAGVWALLKKYAGSLTAVIFVVYMMLNPLSYVWLPFYYTNTVSMPFAVWGVYLLFDAWEVFGGNFPEKSSSRHALNSKSKSVLKSALKCVLSGVLFAVGFKIRATVGIVLIAGLITLFVRKESQADKADAEQHQENLRKTWTGPAICLGVLILSLGLTTSVYAILEKQYLAFDNTDTRFPATHWIAMGLSDTGTFSPLDEVYTAGFETASEKKEAALDRIKERAKDKGPFGVLKLYMKKLALTFGDGAGGYHSELNISRDYGLLWQIVYGVYRDPLLWLTQCWYLVSIVSGIGMVSLLWKKKVNRLLFVFPLTLLGSYLFQMIWEAGTIYSIGTMYVSGAVTAVCFGAFKGDFCALPDTEEQKKGKVRSKKGDMLIFGLIAAFSAILTFVNTEYTDVSMSVDQFLFQAEEYLPLGEGEEITQTFSTNKYFSTISLQAHNPKGDSNDSVYRIGLYDSQGRKIQEKLLESGKVGDYVFYPMAFEAEEGIHDYTLKIQKKSGEDSLTFLYYNTGNYDVYKGGHMTGLNVSDKADLVFRVYWREETDSE